MAAIHPVTANTVGAYRFNEGAQADPALDASGNGRDFIQIWDTAGPVADGKFGGARNFAGVQDVFYRTTADSIPFRTPRFTLSVWLRRDPANTGDDIWSIDRNGGVTLRAQYFRLVSSKLKFRLDFDDASFIEVEDQDVLPVAWQMATVTWNGTTLALFRQGLQVDSDASGAGKTIFYTGTDGRARWGATSGGSNPWNGDMDDGHYYDIGQSPAWVAAAFAGTLGAARVSTVLPGEAAGLFIDADGDLVNDGFGGLKADQSIITRVYLRLQTRRGSLWRDRDFGSLLHTIDTLEGAGPKVLRFSQQALAPLIQAREILRVELGRVEINPTTGGLFASILIHIPKEQAIEIANLKLGG